jgi:TonB family protein
VTKTSRLKAVRGGIQRDTRLNLRVQRRYPPVQTLVTLRSDEWGWKQFGRIIRLARRACSRQRHDERDRSDRAARAKCGGGSELTITRAGARFERSHNASAARRIGDRGVSPHVRSRLSLLLVCAWSACGSAPQAGYHSLSERYRRIDSLPQSATATPRAKPKIDPYAGYGSSSDWQARDYEQIRIAAAEALGCPNDSLDLQIAAPREWLASGCAKSIRYECESRTRCCPYVGPSRIAPIPRSNRDGLATTRISTNDTHSAWELLRFVDECFERNRDLNRLPERVGSLAGNVVLVVTVSAQGKVESVKLERSSVGEPFLESCALAMFQRGQFAPGDRRRFMITYVLVESSPGSADCGSNPAIERSVRRAAE